ncbi:hypothetical protein NDU88_003810 [Pleurodeles waltl]|uniref:Uncharacterized protein n=1 Tax=Pleurodeles waltl TaxID=8319 RepID=A0AAV7PAM2_PLEWA|nr:hypothetical protein NDU88_003810 [Pleurodeles waltl]
MEGEDEELPRQAPNDSKNVRIGRILRCWVTCAPPRVSLQLGPGVRGERRWSERKLPGGVRGSKPKAREDPSEEKTPRIVGNPRGRSPTGTKNHCGPNLGRRQPAREANP